jgi:hypothetical protein
MQHDRRDVHLGRDIMNISEKYEQLGKVQKSPRTSSILHNYSTMDQTMEILHFERKGQMLNTLENFYIQAEHKVLP